MFNSSDPRGESNPFTRYLKPPTLTFGGDPRRESNPYTRPYPSTTGQRVGFGYSMGNPMPQQPKGGAHFNPNYLYSGGGFNLGTPVKGGGDPRHESRWVSSPGSGVPKGLQRVPASLDPKSDWLSGVKAKADAILAGMGAYGDQLKPTNAGFFGGYGPQPAAQSSGLNPVMIAGVLAVAAYLLVKK